MTEKAKKPAPLRIDWRRPYKKEGESPEAYGERCKASYAEAVARAEKRRAANEADKARKLALSMTCQVCGRPIFAESGTIAHHGYERPGHGWQTASCYGAKRLPWECDNTALIEARGHQERGALQDRATARAIRSGEYDSKVYWTEYESTPYGRKQVDKSESVNADTWADVVAANPAIMRHRPGYSFADAQKSYAAEFDRSATQRESFVEYATKRLEGWAPTHKRENKSWILLSR